MLISYITAFIKGHMAQFQRATCGGNAKIILCQIHDQKKLIKAPAPRSYSLTYGYFQTLKATDMADNDSKLDQTRHLRFIDKKTVMPLLLSV